MAKIAEIRNRSLRRLGVLGRGQTARSEDAAEMDQAYLEVHGKLETKGLAVWGDETDDVPDRFVDDVSALVAISRVEEFSVPTPKFQRLAGAASVAENNIRELLSIDKNETTKIEYF